MMDLEQVLVIHQILIKEFGGSEGVRDPHGLKSAIARPFQTFGGNALYPTAVEKSAAVIESIVTNHPFVDGNKRTGYVLMRLILMEEDIDIEATQDEKYAFVIKIASGKMNFDSIREWIQNHLKKDST